MPNRPNIDVYARLLQLFQDTKMQSYLLSDGAKCTDWPSGETGAGGLAFCYTRNAKGLREPERKGCLTPVEFY